MAQRRTGRSAARGKRPRTPARRSGGAASPSVLRPGRADLVEYLETLGEEFDEAGLHVLQRHEFTGLSLSAVRPLPAERLQPGAIGWLREVRAAAPAHILEGEAVESLLGWLYFVMHPTVSLAPSDSGPESPVLGTTWNEFVYAEESRRGPHTLLAARAESEGSAAILRRFTEQVAQELEGEAES